MDTTVDQEAQAKARQLIRETKARMVMLHGPRFGKTQVAEEFPEWRMLYLNEPAIENKMRLLVAWRVQGNRVILLSTEVQEGLTIPNVAFV